MLWNKLLSINLKVSLKKEILPHKKPLFVELACFLPDEDVGACINRHSILVLPYSLESSLNSGTIFLAFSYKRTVISPLIGTLKEFGDADFFYAYDYTNYQEHKRNLKDTINQAIKDWQANQTVFIEKGLKAYYRVKEENSFEKITELYKGLFRELG